jgi:hypothetical protein
LQFADQQWFFPQNKDMKELVCSMAMGKPWVLIQLHELLSHDETLSKQFTDIIPLLSHGKSLFKAHDILKNFKKNGIFESFLDGWIAYAANHDMVAQSKQRMKVKRMSKSNVHIDNLMLYGLLPS